MAKRRQRKKAPPGVDVLVARLASDDPETRWLAAKDLAEHGDRTAIAPLERVALDDGGHLQREGAFVDTTELPSAAALEALAVLYARHPPTPEDIARVRERLADPDCPPGRHEPLAAALGKAVLEAARPFTRHPDPRIRLRAHNVLGRAERARTNHALWLDDEEVRLAATRQDAYRPHLVRDALERFAEEPGARVRRGICDLWLRYQARMGGWLRAGELLHLLTDEDPEIHDKVARHVLETARRKSTWIYDPASLGPTRDRLLGRLARGLEPSPSGVLREVLELLDRALAPFLRGT